MQLKDRSPKIKALEVNQDESIYGTFAEIGAGQEVARHFFRAGMASQTIAKTMSAYDMTFSDEIYGKSGRYVSEERLKKMLDHEYDLLLERLPQRRDRTRFFAFADTVATSADGEKSHGWVGVKFQLRPNGPANQIILHVKMWDNSRLQQQEALGILGANLLHMAFFPAKDPKGRITQLIESLSIKRVEVNMIRFTGNDLIHLDNRLMSLELVHQGLTEAVVFGKNGDVIHASDALYHKPLFVMRGTFRPVTTTNLTILEKAYAQFKNHPICKDLNPEVLFEITMGNLTAEGAFDNEDFLNRVDTLNALKKDVLISKFNLFFQLKGFLRQCTDQPVGIVVGANHLARMFDVSYYKNLGGGILEGFSRLFDDRTRVFVYPFKENGDDLTAKKFRPDPKLQHLFEHLLENNFISDLENCAGVDTSIHSKDVREMLSKRSPKWRDFVPGPARDLIENRQLFGYKP